MHIVCFPTSLFSGNLTALIILRPVTPELHIHRIINPVQGERHKKRIKDYGEGQKANKFLFKNL